MLEKRRYLFIRPAAVIEVNGRRLGDLRPVVLCAACAISESPISAAIILNLSARNLALMFWLPGDAAGRRRDRGRCRRFPSAHGAGPGLKSNTEAVAVALCRSFGDRCRCAHARDGSSSENGSENHLADPGSFSSSGAGRLALVSGERLLAGALHSPRGSHSLLTNQRSKSDAARDVEPSTCYPARVVRCEERRCVCDVGGQTLATQRRGRDLLFGFLLCLAALLAVHVGDC